MNQKYNKAEILLNGIYLLRRKGYHHTGINDILQECRIPKGSFYNFFRSKEDFAAQALDLYGESILRLIRQFTRDESLTPLERLSGYFEMMIEANTEEEMRFGCMLMNFSSELGGYNDRFAESSDRIFRRWIQECTACIERGQQQGEFRTDYLASDLAEYLYTAVFGGLARAKTVRNPEPLGLILRSSLDFITI
jgi:TetR/AcrR family transcriptional repressor of nem operon